jgi:hypothetical protein
MRGRVERGLLALLIVLHLVPLLAAPAFPSQDGASHVEAAFNLRHYGDSSNSLIREFYVLNRSPEPNLLGHVLLVALLEVAPPTVAEKLMVALFVVALPLAVRYAVRAVAADAGWLAVLAFPFIYSWPLHMGFFNFCWGLPLFFVVIGYWVRHRATMSLRHVVDLAALTLLLAGAHVVPLALAIAVIALWLAVERHRIVPTAAAFAPVLLLLGGFLWRKHAVPSNPPPTGGLLLGLVRLESLVSFRDAEVYASTAVAVLFGVLIARGLMLRARGRDQAPHDALLAAIPAFVLLYFVAPRRIAGGAYLNERLALFPFFVAMLWLAGQPFSDRLRRAVQAAAASLAIAALALHLATYVELRGPMAEYLSAAPQLEANRTLLPLSFASQGWGLSRLGPRTKVFLHTASYLAAERSVLNLANYEGNYVHFPLIFRDEVNPFVHLARAQGLEGDPPCLDLEAYAQQTGWEVDYVLLWGMRAHQREGEPCTEQLFAALRRGYDLTFVSEPRRLVRLYTRKGK